MKLIKWLENRVVISDDEVPSKIDVIVSLGEGFNKEGNNFSSQSFRVHFCTLALYERFRTHIIVVGIVMAKTQKPILLVNIFIKGNIVM